MNKSKMDLFCSDGYFSVNKKLCKALGLKAAAMIGNMINKLRYFTSQGQLTEDGEFFLTNESQSEEIGLSIHEIRETKKKLMSLGILQSKMKGLPVKEYFKIDLDKLIEIVYLEEKQGENAHSIQVSKMSTLKGAESRHLSIENVDPLYIYKNKEEENKEEENKEKDIKPEIFRVLDYFMIQNGIEAKKKYSASHIAAVKARMNEGATVEECFMVIDNRIKTWKNDPRMRQYIRIDTLFRPTKFPNYLIAAQQEKRLMGDTFNRTIYENGEKPF